MADDADLVSPMVTRKALPTMDGLLLRAEWAELEDPRRVAVLCHPHPLHGGNMYASVIDHLFRHLPEHGVATLRFNFRGVQGSDGRHDYGRGERLDALAAVDEANRAYPTLPILMIGWSFGGDISLATPHPAISAWCAIAPPLRVVPPTEMAAGSDPRTTTILVPSDDQFAPPSLVQAETETWTSTTITVIEGADHFLNGAFDQILDRTVAALPGAAPAA